MDDKQNISSMSKTGLDIYSHLLPTIQMEAAESVDDFISTLGSTEDMDDFISKLEPTSEGVNPDGDVTTAAKLQPDEKNGDV